MEEKKRSTPKGTGNIQNQTSANQTNVRKTLSSLFRKRGSRNARNDQRTENHKNKITPGKT